MRKVITDEARTLIGKETRPFQIEIEKGAIKKFARAVKFPHEPDPLFFDEEYAKKAGHPGIIAPPTFCTSFYWGSELLDLPLPKYRVGMNGGNEYEYYQPLRPGDVLTGKSRLAELKERPVGQETMLIVTVETDYRNQKDELVLKARNTILRMYPPEEAKA